jgi:hypothetical protein
MRSLLAIVLAASTACVPALPSPSVAEHSADAFVAVPGPPPPARVELVPPRPGHALWVDGAWLWEGTRWRWSDGGWYEPAPGVHYADWTTIRRDDGTLLYANPQWLDARGAPVSAPPRAASARSIGGPSSVKT